MKRYALLSIPGFLFTGSVGMSMVAIIKNVYSICFPRRGRIPTDNSRKIKFRKQSGRRIIVYRARRPRCL